MSYQKPFKVEVGRLNFDELVRPCGGGVPMAQWIVTIVILTDRSRESDKSVHPSSRSERLQKKSSTNDLLCRAYRAPSASGVNTLLMGLTGIYCSNTDFPFYWIDPKLIKVTRNSHNA